MFQRMSAYWPTLWTAQAPSTLDTKAQPADLKAPQPTKPVDLQSDYDKQLAIYNASKASERADYDKSVQAYKVKAEGPPLFRHLKYVLDKNLCSSVGSIEAVLERMGSSHPQLKAIAIDEFNATHRGPRCPFAKDQSFSDSLHLGTTRVWNADGSINEASWKKFVDSASDEQGTIIKLSKLHAYLKQCAEDPEEKNTGRHTSSAPFSKPLQIEAAVAAWDEVYSRLTCGYRPINGTHDWDPFILVSVLREFYEDSSIAYLRAECGLLPAPNPKKLLALSAPEEAGSCTVCRLM